MKRALDIDSHVSPRPRILHLNVGGRKFDTTTATLMRIPYFHPFLEGRFEVERDVDGYLFIDRCGDLFGNILQFARCAQRPSQNVVDMNRYALLAECDFYGTESLARHLREETSPLDLRFEDRRLKEEETNALNNITDTNDNFLLDFFQLDHTPLKREGLELHLLFNKKARAEIEPGGFEGFRRRLNKFSGGLLDDLAIPETVIAGGSIVPTLGEANELSFRRK